MALLTGCTEDAPPPCGLRHNSVTEYQIPLAPRETLLDGPRPRSQADPRRPGTFSQRCDYGAVRPSGTGPADRAGRSDDRGIQVLIAGWRGRTSAVQGLAVEPQRSPRSEARTRAVVIGVLTALMCSLAALLPPSASAHAELVSSDPAADSVIERPPAAIELMFAEAVGGAEPKVIITVDGFDPVEVTPVLGGKKVTADLSGVDIPGAAGASYPTTWKVGYRLVAADGDAFSGAFTITVAAGPPPAPSEPATSEPPTSAPVTSEPVTPTLDQTVGSSFAAVPPTTPSSIQTPTSSDAETGTATAVSSGPAGTTTSAVSAATTTAAEDSGSSPWWWVAAIVVVVVIGAATVLTKRRSRGATPAR